MLLLLLIACTPPAEKPEADTDAEADADTDADADADTDADSDVGPGVLLYNGNGGGAYDIYEDDLVALYADAGIDATVSSEVPSGLADTYGLLVLLSPTGGFPADAVDEGQALLARGGRVVVVTEHSGYGDHEGASAFLADLGSTLRSVYAQRTGTQVLGIDAVPPLTEGVSSLELYYCADVDVGRGEALGVRADGEPGIGWEAVDRGDVVLVPDGSLFGYALGNADNARFVRNLAAID